MLKVLIAIWAIFIIFLLYICVKRVINYEKVVPFWDDKRIDIPFITIQVGGIDMNMIVDSGCGIAIINKSALERIDNYKDSPRQVDLVALTPDSVSNKMVTIPVNVCGKDINTDFSVYDTEDFCNFMRFYGIEAHGLLGTEFLEAANCKLDFKEHKVTMS